MSGLLTHKQCLHSQHTCLLRPGSQALRTRAAQVGRAASPVLAKAKPADELRALPDKELDQVVKSGKVQLYYFRSVIAGIKKTRDRAIKSHEISATKKRIARALTIKTERQKEGARPM
ncbi:hypothetical protein WJX74_001356 [Apatococcus lobatus]|uniref:Ribosomal protein L35 n=1 Tax=Apatococcus lobatus TaxID=904363 RepID=A0AAW1S4I3_9CHLO